MTDDSIRLRVLRGDEEQAAVFDWWAKLSGHGTAWDGQSLDTGWPAGVRAVLRRARAPDDALLSEGFRHLWFALPESRRKPWEMTAWGCIAAVLAEVRTHQPGIEFAAAMGGEVEKGAGKPRVSELRFSQLQHSNDLNELQRRMRRMVHLLDEKVNVLSLADGILHWQREHAGYVDVAPDRRLPVRWATAYFSELARYQPVNTN
ncbi:MAG TPA: type I-E CRISPR-associated protein Cse2/CasB [Gammaproteobacteria bacterium]|nr:type I-E CRISPR-associated protein Cse2/CasB [Gammaproteobacteria bacterium]